MSTPPNIDAPELLDQRKADHIALCHEEEVEGRNIRTLLDQVHLTHQSLPEISWQEIDTRVEVLGRTLCAPLMISGMTGGTERARGINRILAKVAQKHGFGFGLGSQRTMMRDDERSDSYIVRDVAPDILLLGNLGVVQAAQSSTQEVEDLIGRVGADALCVHLNPAQEMIQDDGDRDFRGCVDALARLNEELSVPVIAKETGAGMSRPTLSKIHSAGVPWVDVSGAGGTSWVGVESMRNSPELASVGDVLWDWGVPTAPSIIWAKRQELSVIASGGIRHGLDAARAIALGASVASAALPWLRAAMDGGEERADEVATNMLRTLKTVMLLTGSKTINDLHNAPKRLGPSLRDWIAE